MAEPRTINIPGEGSPTLSYTLPPGLFQYVESVRIEIDNSGGADATPVLSVSEQSGVVLADKEQGRSIPAGESGSATWALRLDDERTATPSGGGIQFDTDNEGGWLFVQTNDENEGGGSPNGRGIELRSADTGGMRLYSATKLQLSAVDFGTFICGSDLLLQSQTSGVNIDASASVNITSAVSLVHIGPATDFTVLAGGDIVMASPSMFQLKQGATTPYLQVNKVGAVWTYHIKTGAVWVADL